MGLDGPLQPARHRRQNSRAPARSAVDIDVSAAPRPIGTHIGGFARARQSAQRGRSKGRSAHEEIVRRLDRTIRATQLARDLLRCQHDLAHGFFNG
jgi:hypothetical protein